MKFCYTFKRAIRILWNLLAICQALYWSQGCMTVCVFTNVMRGWRTKQEILDPWVGQKCCTRTLKTEQHLCLWKACYHYPANCNRMIKKAKICCIFLKWVLSFEGSHNIGEVLTKCLEVLSFKNPSLHFSLKKRTRQSKCVKCTLSGYTMPLLLIQPYITHCETVDVLFSTLKQLLSCLESLC